MAGLPQFPISTQTDPYWEIPMYDAAGNPLSIEGRVFEAWIAPAQTKQGVAEPVKEIKVLTFQDGMTLVPPTDGVGDQAIKNTLVHQVSREFAQAHFPRGELTADLLEVVDGARRLFSPVRLFYLDPAQIREYVADRAGITFGQGRQPIVTPVAIAGQAGRRGSGLITGTLPPQPSDGEDGDYWIVEREEQANLVYGPKEGGEWPPQPSSTFGVKGVADVPGAAASGTNSDIKRLTGLTTPLSENQGGTGAALFGDAIRDATTFARVRPGQPDMGAELSAAALYAFDNGFGGVEALAGVHTLASKIVLQSGVQMCGVGQSRATLRKASGSPAFNLIEQPQAVAEFVVRDLTIDGNAANQSNQEYTLVSVENDANASRDGKITDLTLRNIPTIGHGVHVKGCDTLLVERISARGGGADLYHAVYVRRVQNITARDIEGRDLAGSVLKIVSNSGYGRVAHVENVHGYRVHRTVNISDFDFAEIRGGHSEDVADVAYRIGVEALSTNQYGKIIGVSTLRCPYGARLIGVSHGGIHLSTFVDPVFGGASVRGGTHLAILGNNGRFSNAAAIDAGGSALILVEDQGSPSTIDIDHNTLRSDLAAGLRYGIWVRPVGASVVVGAGNVGTPANFTRLIQMPSGANVRPVALTQPMTRANLPRPPGASLAGATATVTDALTATDGSAVPALCIATTAKWYIAGTTTEVAA